MKSAEAVLRELTLHVRPLAGCAIVLTEWTQGGPAGPNWVAEKVAELRKAEPIIEWSDVKILVGDQRRIAHWLSETEDDN